MSYLYPEKQPILLNPASPGSTVKYSKKNGTVLPETKKIVCEKK